MKKLLAILLSLALLVSFVGCGEQTADASSKVSSKASSVQSVVSKNETASKEPEQEPFYSKTVTFTKADLDKANNTEFVKPKNIIVIIGDGMGLNDITICNKFSDFKFDFGLVLDQLKNKGFATTRSASSDVTDSAASATALATGTKTANGMVGQDMQGKDLKNISEIARECGKKVGIVTSDSVLGATPSGFTVHNESRHNKDELARSFMRFKPDLLIGNGYSDFVSGISAEEDTKALFKTVNIASDFGMFEYCLTKSAKKNEAFFGFMGFGMKSGDYSLGQATEIALKSLENDNGFFLMVENAGTDSAGHNNKIQGKVDNVAFFDKAVAVAVKYCMEHPDTMLIVTSDHETGGVTLPEGDDYQLSDVKFTTTDHTGVNVGVFALGYGTEYFNGQTVDNTDIAKFAIKAVKGEW